MSLELLPEMNSHSEMLGLGICAPFRVASCPCLTVMRLVDRCVTEGNPVMFRTTYSSRVGFFPTPMDVDSQQPLFTEKGLRRILLVEALKVSLFIKGTFIALASSCPGNHRTAVLPPVQFSEAAKLHRTRCLVAVSLSPMSSALQAARHPVRSNKKVGEEKAPISEYSGMVSC